MSIQININNIVEEMEMQLEESVSFLHIETGEIVGLLLKDLIAAEDEEPFEHLPDWQQENRKVAIDVVKNSDIYRELPTKEEIDEYDIMEDFCLSIRDERKRDKLIRAIRGKGAFRRFKDRIIDLDIEDQWYFYRGERFKQIAVDWCNENNINFVDNVINS